MSAVSTLLRPEGGSSRPCEAPPVADVANTEAQTEQPQCDGNDDSKAEGGEEGGAAHERRLRKRRRPTSSCSEAAEVEALAKAKAPTPPKHCRVCNVKVHRIERHKRSQKHLRSVEMFNFNQGRRTRRALPPGADGTWRWRDSVTGSSSAAAAAPSPGTESPFGLQGAYGSLKWTPVPPRAVSPSCSATRHSPPPAAGSVPTASQKALSPAPSPALTPTISPHMMFQQSPTHLGMGMMPMMPMHMGMWGMQPVPMGSHLGRPHGYPQPSMGTGEAPKAPSAADRTSPSPASVLTDTPAQSSPHVGSWGAGKLAPGAGGRPVFAGAVGASPRAAHGVRGGALASSAPSRLASAPMSAPAAPASLSAATVVDKGAQLSVELLLFLDEASDDLEPILGRNISVRPFIAFQGAAGTKPFVTGGARFSTLILTPTPFNTRVVTVNTDDAARHVYSTRKLAAYDQLATVSVYIPSQVELVASINRLLPRERGGAVPSFQAQTHLQACSVLAVALTLPIEVGHFASLVDDGVNRRSVESLLPASSATTAPRACARRPASSHASSKPAKSDAGKAGSGTTMAKARRPQFPPQPCTPASRSRSRSRSLSPMSMSLLKGHVWSPIPDGADAHVPPPASSTIPLLNTSSSDEWDSVLAMNPDLLDVTDSLWDLSDL